MKVRDIMSESILVKKAEKFTDKEKEERPESYKAAVIASLENMIDDLHGSVKADKSSKSTGEMFTHIQKAQKIMKRIK